MVALLGVLHGRATADASGTAGSELFLPPCGDSAPVSVHMDASGLLLRHGSTLPLLVRIDEVGRDLATGEDAASEWIHYPPRWGTGVVALSASSSLMLRPAQVGLASAAARVTPLCGDQGRRLGEWIRTASRLSIGFGGSAGGLTSGVPEGGLAQLLDTAPDPRARALAQHLRAQALVAAGRSKDAAEAFTTAAEAWNDAGDKERANAALAAAAEDLNRTARFGDAIALARRSGMPDGSHYYGVRLENARCLALRYLGDLEEASRCYAWTIERLDELEEPVELAAAVLDFGTIELERGRLQTAVDLFARARDLAAGPRSAEVRGRAEFYLGYALGRDGRIDDAIRHLHAAAEQFHTAAAGRWRGSTLLRLASMLADLGAMADAQAALDEASSHFDEDNAPARVAAVHLVQARISARLNDAAAAAAAARSALAIYERLQMDLEAGSAASLLIGILAESGGMAEARALLQRSAQASGPGAAMLLNRAEMALKDGHPAAASRHLSQARLKTPRWRERVRIAAAEAAIAVAAGRPREALGLLQQESRSLLVLRDRLPNAILAAPVDALLDQVDAIAIDLLADALAPHGLVSEQETIALVENWLPFTRSRGQSGSSLGGSTMAMDRSVAEDLFPSVFPPAGESSDSLQLSLLRTLVPDPATERKRAGPAHLQRLRLQDFGTMLPQGGRVVALLDGRRSALVLVHDGASTRVHRIADRTVLLDSVLALRAALAHASTPLGEVADAASDVAALFGDTLAGAAASVLVIAHGTARDIPWPVLALDPSAEALRQGVLSLVVPVRMAPRGEAPPSGAPVHVLIASQAQRGGMLAPLRAAQVEADVLAHSLAGRTLQRHEPGSRAALLRALHTPNAWVHVAAHGTLVPGRIAGSGLWLDPPAAGQPPEYLSALELLGRRVRADLVVLDACQLASAATHVPSSSLAVALVEAGAGQVIAAQWPVSDTSSAVWLKAMYASAGQAESAAPALARARGALRRSRAFRHPYYWAGLVHMTGLR